MLAMVRHKGLAAMASHSLATRLSSDSPTGRGLSWLRCLILPRKAFLASRTVWSLVTEARDSPNLMTFSERRWLEGGPASPFLGRSPMGESFSCSMSLVEPFYVASSSGPLPLVDSVIFKETLVLQSIQNCQAVIR